MCMALASTLIVLFCSGRIRILVVNGDFCNFVFNSEMVTEPFHLFHMNFVHISAFGRLLGRHKT